MTFDILPIIIAVIAASPGILAYLIQRQKGPHETVAILTDAATDLVEQLRGDMVQLRTEVRELRNENKELRREIEVLKCENEDLTKYARKLAQTIKDLGATPPEAPVK